jgi:hypothetical protein
MLVLNPNLNCQLPHELMPGKMWDGIAIQDKILDAVGHGGYLICQIFHSHTKRPVKKQVVIK